MVNKEITCFNCGFNFSGDMGNIHRPLISPYYAEGKPSPYSDLCRIILSLFRAENFVFFDRTFGANPNNPRHT